jgi:hypothetical protein
VDTTVKDQARTPARTAAETATRSGTSDVPDARTTDAGGEIDELLRIKRSRRIDAGRLPCPCCGLVIAMTINRCPFCESDVAAETALARETMRRLQELSGEIEVEHDARTREKPKRRGFFRRLKYLFEGDPEPDADDAPAVDPYAKRLLTMVSPGDSLKVLAEDGPWLQVKTNAGIIGWVYSTVRKDP